MVKGKQKVEAEYRLTAICYNLLRSLSILEREELVMDLASASNAVIEVMPEIQELTDKAIRDLTRNGASVQQVFVAGRQLVLSDRILRHLAEMLRGGPGAVAAADSFTQEI